MIAPVMFVLVVLLLIVLLLMVWAVTRSDRLFPGLGDVKNPIPRHARMQVAAYILVPLNQGTDMSSKVLPLLSLAIINASFTDSFGHAVAHTDIDGIPVWEVDHPGLVVLTPAADGFSAQIASNILEGNVTVTVTANAKVGDGVEKIVGILAVPIQDMASSVVLSLGDPAPITPGAPVETAAGPTA